MDPFSSPSLLSRHYRKGAVDILVKWPTPPGLAVESEFQCQHIYLLVCHKVSIAFYRGALGKKMYSRILRHQGIFFCCFAASADVALV